ncbi:hypothetical protein RI129_010153 [Pyrocoelia pectoralis]|uniref:Major facilitator superfamily (MFS) profile domain-containing protein n=1 Tax=Pyrocoelia pectoralis TaxID=417401 RepID=A0AAN7V9X6_9COLE
MINSMCKFEILPTRAKIGITIFMACFFNYMLRVNMSINLIAMVQPNNENNKTHIAECLIINGKIESRNRSEDFSQLSIVPDYGSRYEWNSKQQGLILASYFWGTILTSIPGGYLAERFGPTKTVAISSIISAFATVLTPLVAPWSWIAVIVFRFILGLMAGVCYPALHCMVARWVPPNEKGKFAGALLGGTIGTVVTWPLSGSIIQHLGWTWAFYIQGGLVFLFSCVWLIVVSDSPNTHPRISKEEKFYINNSLGDGVGKAKGTPPYLKILTSIPFWALAALHFGNLWGLYLLLTAGPKYMSEVLGFNLGHSGLLAALPYLARAISGFIFGYVGDVIRKREVLSVTVTRKLFVTTSHFLPGILLFTILCAGCNVTVCVILITLSLGFNGSSSITNIQNNQDLSPNFAGSIYGIINCIGGTTGFFTPMITGYLTAEQNGLKEWHTIFAIGASVYIATGIIFCIFGSGERQPWNQIDAKPIEGVENPAFDVGVTKVSEEENTKV